MLPIVDYLSQGVLLLRAFQLAHHPVAMISATYIYLGVMHQVKLGAAGTLISSFNIIYLASLSKNIAYTPYKP